MADRNFRKMLESRWAEGTFVCVGLDSVFGEITAHAYRYHGEDRDSRVNVLETMVAFNEAIIRATHDLVCAYKVNLAPYLAQGGYGLHALKRTVGIILSVAPNIPVILDEKDGDVLNTNLSYVEWAFDFLQADAVTLNPYFGGIPLQPFFERKDKGVFVVCRSSNKGAEEFQDLEVRVDWEEAKFLTNAGTTEVSMGRDGCHARMYLHVAYRFSNYWNKNGNCGMVVGATHPYELENVRRVVGNMPILSPAIGVQGGDLRQTVSAGVDSRGLGLIISSSRDAIFASKGEDFADATRSTILELRDASTAHRDGAMLRVPLP